MHAAMCKTQPVGFAVRHRGLRPLLPDNLEGWDGLGGGREVQEGGDVCMLMADSYRVAETGTVL